MVLQILSALFYPICSYFFVDRKCNKDNKFESGGAVQNCSATGRESLITASQVY